MRACAQSVPESACCPRRLSNKWGICKVETAGDCWIGAAGVLGPQGDDGFSSVLDSHDPVDSACRMMGFAQVGGRWGMGRKGDMERGGEGGLLMLKCLSRRWAAAAADTAQVLLNDS